jgi:PPOX class probable F420-dependent enzyme
MASLTDAQRAFIRDNPHVGVLTTIRDDGSPHSTVVWLDTDGDEIVFNTATGRAKERHVRANPQVSMIVVDPSDPYKWVAVSGPASLETKGGREMIDRLSQKYQGKDYPEEWLGEGEVRVTGRIRPEHVDSSGFGS